MKNQSSRIGLYLVLLLATLGLLAAPVSAQSDDSEVRKEVRIKRVHKCDGDAEDCALHKAHALAAKHGKHGKKRVMFIDDSGNVTRLDGEEGDNVWVSEDGEGHSFVFHNDGPKTFLGVQINELTPELRAHFGVPEDSGVLVAKVIEDSPARIAGIEVGDVITAIDGQQVDSQGGLLRLLGKRDVGETVAVEVYRDGGVETMTASLAERETPEREFFFKGDSAHGDHDTKMEKAYAMAKKIVVDCDGDDCEDGDLDVHVMQHDFSEQCAGLDDCRGLLRQWRLRVHGERRGDGLQLGF